MSNMSNHRNSEHQEILEQALLPIRDAIVALSHIEVPPARLGEPCSCTALDNKESNHSSNKTSNYSRKSSSNGDGSENLSKLLKEKENSLSTRDILITMLQAQLKKMEELYKKSLDDQQEMRYKYSTVVHELSKLKIISGKLDAENKKLSKQPDFKDCFVKGRNELLQESEKWKNKYEDLVSRVLDLERVQSDSKQQQVDNLMRKFKNIENMLNVQNEKLNSFFNSLEDSNARTTDVSDLHTIQVRNDRIKTDISKIYDEEVINKGGSNREKLNEDALPFAYDQDFTVKSDTSTEANETFKSIDEDVAPTDLQETVDTQEVPHPIRDSIDSNTPSQENPHPLEDTPNPTVNLTLLQPKIEVENSETCGLCGLVDDVTQSDDKKAEIENVSVEPSIDKAAMISENLCSEENTAPKEEELENVPISIQTSPANEISDNNEEEVPKSESREPDRTDIKGVLKELISDKSGNKLATLIELLIALMKPDWGITNLVFRKLLEAVREPEEKKLEYPTEQKKKDEEVPVQNFNFLTVLNQSVTVEDFIRNIQVIELSDGRHAFFVNEQQPNAQISAVKTHEKHFPATPDKCIETTLESTDTTIDSLKQIIELQKAEISDLKAKLEEKYKELCCALCQDREHMDHSTNLLEEYEKNIDAINARYTIAMKELDGVLDNNKVLKQKVSDLQRFLEQHEEQMTLLGMEARKSSERYQDMNEVFDDMETELVRKDREIAELKSMKFDAGDYRKTINDLTKMNKELNDELQEKDNCIVDKKHQIKELEIKLRESMNENVKIYNHHSDIHAEQLKCICADLNGKLQETKVELDKQNVRAKDNDQNLQMLIESNKKLQNQLTLGSQQETKLINELNMVLTKFELEKDKLLVENEYLANKLQAETAEFKEQQDKLKQNLDSVMTENEKLKMELELANDKLKMRESEEFKQLVKYKGDNADLQDKLKMSNAELKCLKESSKQNVNLKGENSRLKMKMTTLDKRLVDLAEAEHTIDELKYTNEMLMRKIDELEKELRTSSREKLAILTCLDVGATCTDQPIKPLTPINEESQSPVAKVSSINENDSIKITAEVKLLYDNLKYGDESNISNKDPKDVGYHETLLDSPKRSVDKSESMIISTRKPSSGWSKQDVKTKSPNLSEANCNIGKQTPQRTSAKSCKIPVTKSNAAANKSQYHNKAPPRACSKCPHGHNLKRP